MRITQGIEQSQFLTALNQLESNISTTQNGISTGLSFSTASQDPVAAGLVSGYNQVLAQSQQFTSNGQSAQGSLNIEDNALTQAQSQLQSLRDLALEANNATESGANLSAIATQVQQIQQTLLSVANTQDGSGNYIFAGYSTQTQPFALTTTGASYSGDQGQRQVQLAAGQTVVVGDNGDLVFNQTKTGNGTFNVTADAANAGSGIIGATSVSDPSAYAGGSYQIQFTAPGTYQVLNSANAVVTTGTYTNGQAISFAGIQVTLSGTPATGDTFAVAPSTNQSIFTTVQNLVNALQRASTTTQESTSLNNTIANTIDNLDQALNQVQTVQSSVGARLNTITTQQSTATAQQTQLQQSISTLQSLNYPQAITNLDSQNTTLSAAMQAYTLTEGLSLFKYIS
ncbi:MAG TPA: flagellar hook-associated protein FlgL [Steroidobacteraceae bacterium]|jgi:flagellar hook-associated protein 3 FlgL|nr:flagellar hook-associated protein FlgL [Steroidobacteraceae bacterium]